MSGKTFNRMLAELTTLDDGNFDVSELSVRFNVSESRILFDFLFLRTLDLVEIFPRASEGICELCDKQGKRITHHWKDCYGFHTRTLCISCNSILGRIFRGNYPSWRDQVEAFVWHQNGYHQPNLGSIFRGRNG